MPYLFLYLVFCLVIFTLFIFLLATETDIESDDVEFSFLLSFIPIINLTILIVAVCGIAMKLPKICRLSINLFTKTIAKVVNEIRRDCIESVRID